MGENCTQACAALQAKSSHATVQPEVPDLLRTMKITSVSSSTDQSTAKIPLYDLAIESEHCVAWQAAPLGRILYIGFSNKDSLEK